MNFTALQGRLTKDIEIRYTGNGVAVANFTLAVDRPFKNAQGERDTDFISCVAFRKTAETIGNYFKKGDGLIISNGRIQTRNYENNQGQRVYVTEVVVESFSFPIQSKSNSNQPMNQSYQQESRTHNNQNTNFNKEPFASNDQKVNISDSDLPF